jgi:hypothetical protein
LIDRFQTVVDETAKAIEDEINSNIVSRQRAIETQLKKLEHQTSTIDELKRKLDKNYVEQQQSNQQLLDRLELATQKTQQ